MPLRIESLDNSRLKLIRKLAAKKHRDAEGRFIIEGINLLEEAIRKNVQLDLIVMADDFRYDEDRLRLSDIAELCVVSRTIYEKLCDADNGSGILAVAKKNIYTEESIELSCNANVLVLDRVQDPGNIGTMIRTSVAAGYELVVVCKGTADLYSPKVLRATAGMVFHVPVLFTDDAETTAELLRRLGKRICVTVPRGGVPYYERNLSEGIALVIGNEGNGISDELIELSDEKVTIPMMGEIESLNAAVSAAILMYEAVRR
ncbi:MAG: RNA methyltransferase [Clostridiales bacterium]|nr:RNA methyltransferase [Candidatus Crickella merdequi]